MRTSSPDVDNRPAAIVAVAEGANAFGDEGTVVAELARLQRARAFAEPLLLGQTFKTGEDAMAHADGVAAIVRAIGAAPSMQAAVYLVYAGEYLTDPQTVVAQAFGPSYAGLVMHTRKLVQVQRSALNAWGDETDPELQAQQLERVRKMLLAFSKDLRVVVLRLASRLQTLRHFALTKLPCPTALAREAQQVFAPLASRLGIWQVKWELEDLAFRFLVPDEYRRIARMLEEKRVEREQTVERDRLRVLEALKAAGLQAQVYGRPKHIYSIWKKMRGKQLEFSQVMDVRALRVIVPTVTDCYTALSRIHALWTSIPEEFDDYIARPKPNGYQSLHTVVLDEAAKPLEIQIRTQGMHDHAESGVAAHWAYKEAGTRGYAGVSAAGDFEERVALARREVLQQLLAWERDLAGRAPKAGTENLPPTGQGWFEDRIYVLSPQATVIELPAGATPVDFAYSLHTDLGHRCRGARVDGAMVPLQTRLQSGQTVEIIATKEGGPSLDWLNPQLGYLSSARARAKVRSWFNARALQETLARGREAVEKLLQREGRTALKLDDLASQLGFRSADALFEVVGKDEYSLRNIESLLRPEPVVAEPELQVRAPRSGATGKGAVLVVGVDSLLTQLAHCCRPAPPDAIGGFVTRSKGVSVHRGNCTNFREMVARHPERMIEVAWNQERPASVKASDPVYPVDISVTAHDRQGLLRDISEVLARERTNVIGVHTQSVDGTARMTFTLEVPDSRRLSHVLMQVGQISGVEHAKRK